MSATSPLDGFSDHLAAAMKFVSTILPNQYDIREPEDRAKYSANALVGDACCLSVVQESRSRLSSNLNDQVEIHLLTIVYTLLVGYECGFGRCEDYAFLLELFAILDDQHHSFTTGYFTQVLKPVLNGETFDHLFLYYSYSAPLMSRENIPVEMLRGGVLIDPFSRLVATPDESTTISLPDFKQIEINSALRSYACWGVGLSLRAKKKTSCELGVYVDQSGFEINQPILRRYVISAFTVMKQVYQEKKVSCLLTNLMRSIQDLASLDQLSTLSTGFNRSECAVSSVLSPGFFSLSVSSKTTPHKQILLWLKESICGLGGDRLSWKYSKKSDVFWVQINADQGEPVSTALTRLNVNYKLNKVSKSEDLCIQLTDTIEKLTALNDRSAKVGLEYRADQFK